MKKSLLLLTALAVAGMSSTSAQAANHYVSALAGVSWMQDNNVGYSSSYATDPNVWHNNFDSGVTGVAAIGCDYGSTRLEVEGGYQRNDFSEVDYPYANQSLNSPSQTGRTAVSGKTSVYTLMANGFYDIPLGGGVELYGMAGLGVAQVNFDGNYAADEYYGEDTTGDPYVDALNLTYPAYVDSVPLHFESHATTFAYQLGAGITIPLSKGVVLDARYRYFATADFTLTGPAETGWDSMPIGLQSQFRAYEYSTRYSEYGLNTHISSHSVLLGLRVDI